MPAVTPPLVDVLPSRTKMASGSTVICGYSSARRSATSQWVVALLPCSRPQAARMNAPLHTLAMRADRAAAALTCFMISGFSDVASASTAPGTTRISGERFSSVVSAVSTRPDDVRTRPGVQAANTGV